ncbi:hypothetical protein LOTGIDRAFT_236164 [Lottia gigantea]|uniref:Innexin n=1 Tax=Lottia gigantea TaxID=225164 RepID=V3ZQ73_LOTGI|nr:hypothetical protein LOTGIDRAFT_236164 [Lottia gigantea]ESO84655.1 hypothetical protein LOTGIDRAFT_236164 [Lottia gigantea]
MIWCGYKDVVNQLNFVWTTLILALSALFIGYLRYFHLQSLITCWTPAHFGDIENAYVHQTCWERDTAYALQLNEPLPVDLEDYGNSRPVVHTWIPILLIYLIIGFKIPEAIKVLLDLCTGSQPKSLVASTDSWEGRCASLAECGRDIVQRNGIVKTLSFFLVKIFILINLVAQFSFIRIFFRDQMMSNNVTVNVLPKYLLCDFKIRQIQNVGDYVVQCEFPVNTLYEVFFRLFGYWVLGVGLLAGAIFLFQIGTLMVPLFVAIRFRGIIPEKELKLRGFSVDDALLFLEEVKDEFGVAMARSVASKMWQNPKTVRNGEHQDPMNEYNSGDASVYPLLDRPPATDKHTENA